MRRTLVVVLLVLLSTTWIPARAATVDVDITDFAFTPSTLTVTEGDIIVWHQKGKASHSVTSDDNGATFDSSPNCDAAHTDSCMKPGDTFKLETGGPATFTYHCKVHSSMRGTIVVQPASTSTSEATTTTASTTTTTAPTTTSASTTSSTTTSSTTTTSSSTTTTTSTTLPSSASSAAPVTVNDSDGSSSAPWLVLGALLVGGLAALAYWLWWRSGQHSGPGSGPTGEPPPTTQGPQI